MFIRYFATNRDRENLGRNVDRKDRLVLQEGGYHWLNMKQYMAHYLDTTDASNFPEKVYVLDSEKYVFKGFLAKKSIKRILICVHGFNVELHEAHTWFNIFAKTLRCTSFQKNELQNTLITDPFDHNQKRSLDDDSKNLTAVVGFSWPSNGNALSYESDRAEALSSQSVLAGIIARIKTLCKDTNPEIVVIAHSMGNLLTCSMLASIVNKGFAIPEFKFPDYREDFENNNPKQFINKYIMIAPDIERRQITQCDLYEHLDGEEPDADLMEGDENEKIPAPKSIYLGVYHSGLKYAVGKVHNFYSRFDKALEISNTEKTVREKFQGIKEFFSGKENPEWKYEQRLGLTEHAQAISPGNVYSHNAVSISNREIDHSDYQDCLPVMEVIAEIILHKDK